MAVVRVFRWTLAAVFVFVLLPAGCGGGEEVNVCTQAFDHLVECNGGTYTEVDCAVADPDCTPRPCAGNVLCNSICLLAANCEALEGVSPDADAYFACVDECSKVP